MRQESHGEDIFLNNGSAGPGGRSIAVTHIRTRTKPLWVTQAFGREAVPTAYSTEVTRTCLIWMNDGEEAVQHLYQVLVAVENQCEDASWAKRRVRPHTDPVNLTTVNTV